MDFFKIKLIMTIVTVALIIIDDVDADPISTKVCVEKLERAGYKSTDDGLTNYIESIFNKFFDEGHSVEEFKQVISFNSYKNCDTHQWESLGSHEDNLEKYYRCFLMIFIRYLPVKVDRVRIWCAEKYHSYEDKRTNEAVIDQNRSYLLDCHADLKSDQFDFSFGIESYAYLLRIKRDSDKYNSLKTWTTRYIEYLNEESPKNFGELEGTTKWCQNFNCEIELKAAGFVDRYHGFSNYKQTVVEKYESNCDNSSLEGKSKDYCEHLIQVYKNFKPDKFIKLSVDHGTHVWCKDNNHEDEKHEDSDAPESVCVETLDHVGYQPSNGGLTNYIDRIFKTYFDKGHDLEEFKRDMTESFEYCEMSLWDSHGLFNDHVDEYYKCYLMTYIHDLPVKIYNYRKWCVENYTIDVPHDQIISPFLTCHGDIETDKFNFPSGIYSYAFYLWIKNDQNKYGKLQKFTKLYAAYLEELGPKNNDALENTTIWCKNFECEKTLHAAGFDDRFRSLPNYKKMGTHGFKCDSLIGIAKEYCNHLISVYHDNNSLKKSRRLTEDPGTHVWCKLHNS